MRSTRRMLVLATVAMLSGCSGENMSASETMSMEEYFSQLDVIAQTTDTAFAEWEQETSDTLESATSPEEANEIFRPLLEDAGAIVQTTMDQLEDLSPPEEVADAHAAFMDSIRAGQVAFQRILDDYDNLGFDGAVAAIQGEELQELEQEQDSACAELQTIANDNGIDVDLDCGG